METEDGWVFPETIPNPRDVSDEWKLSVRSSRISLRRSFSLVTLFRNLNALLVRLGSVSLIGRWECIGVASNRRAESSLRFLSAIVIADSDLYRQYADGAFVYPNSPNV